MFTLRDPLSKEMAPGFDLLLDRDGQITQRKSEAKMTQPKKTAPEEADEFQALRYVKVGRPITTEMQERLTLLKLAEQKLWGLTLTNAGEMRLIQQKAPTTGAFPRAMYRRR